MICVVVLQNCTYGVEGDTCSCSETCVTNDVDWTEEVSFKVEEAVDIKGEIPEALIFPSIKIEHEVRFQGVCEVVVAHDFRPFIASKIKLRNYALGVGRGTKNYSPLKQILLQNITDKPRT